MKKSLGFSLLFVLFFTSLCAMDSCDRSAINSVIEHFTYAWNQCEGRGSGDRYAEDADFVNIFGAAFSGRQEIETRHVKILETFLKGSLFEVTETKVREVKPDVAIAQVYWTVTRIQKPGAESMKGIFTHTLVKSQDVWEIASTQNTSIAH